MGAADFGEIDLQSRSLVSLPTFEAAGLIWVCLDPSSQWTAQNFLCGYEEHLAAFNFGSWHIVATGQQVGPNWKIAYDGYLDYYHLPILHRNTFGTDIGNKAKDALKDAKSLTKDPKKAAEGLLKGVTGGGDSGGSDGAAEPLKKLKGLFGR